MESSRWARAHCWSTASSLINCLEGQPMLVASLCWGQNWEFHHHSMAMKRHDNRLKITQFLHCFPVTLLGRMPQKLLILAVLAKDRWGIELWPCKNCLVVQKGAKCAFVMPGHFCLRPLPRTRSINFTWSCATEGATKSKGQARTFC